MLINLIKNFAPFLVAHVGEWLENRALVIRKSDLERVAQVAGTTPEALQDANKAVVSAGVGWVEEYLQEHFKI